MVIEYLGNYEQRMSKWMSIINDIQEIVNKDKKVYISNEPTTMIMKFTERLKILTKHPKFSFLPSPPDDRDYGLCNLRIPKLSKLELPKKKINFPPPWILDQEDTPFCGGASGAGSSNSYYNWFQQLAYKGFSMSFLYWLAKMYDGVPNEEGTYLRTINKIMQKYGMCEEILAPLSEMKQKSIITQKMTDNAAQYKINSYAQLHSLEEIKSALVDGKYVLIGTIVTSNNWYPEDGFLSLPNGYILGGHATFLYGYDDDLQHGKHKGYLYGINSWGTEWGDKGRFYLPYDYYHWESIDMPGFKAFLEAWVIDFQELGTPNDNGDDNGNGDGNGDDNGNGDNNNGNDDEHIDPNVFYRVVTGSFNSKKKAQARVDELKTKGYDSFIVKHNIIEDEENNGNDGEVKDCPATLWLAITCVALAILNLFKRKERK